MAQAVSSNDGAWCSRLVPSSIPPPFCTKENACYMMLMWRPTAMCKRLHGTATHLHARETKEAERLLLRELLIASGCKADSHNW
eukprot:scaffold287586_cov19-Tisochrysis_lutea.AAC.2